MGLIKLKPGRLHGMATALLAVLGGNVAGRDPVGNLVKPQRLLRTPEQVQARLDNAAARRKRKAAFRLNQANYTNIRVRRQMV